MPILESSTNEKTIPLSVYKKVPLTLLALALALPLAAQKKNQSFQLHIHKTTAAIEVDGIGNDLAWQDTDVATNFYMVLPMDTGMANEPSEIRMTYDENNLYLLATFYNATKGPYYVESLRRDFSFGKNDNFLLFMDPFNNQTTGYSFGSNAAGAQWDGTMHSGGSVDLNWDSKWVSAVTSDDEKWVFEMAIPFKSIRYEDGVMEWGINFSRLDLKSGEKSSWTPIPRQFPTASLAYTGTLVWDSPPPTPKTNFSIIPYVLGGIGEDMENNTDTQYDKKIGGDVKFSLSTSLNLDLTVNPDFSQVEVDRQVTNLDRFELFFPEKRQFFLENGDLFANFGYATIRPFFSRRIGLGVPIRAGARVSGNLNKKWRLGLMDMQTASIDETGLPSQNFGVLSLQRKVFARSSIGLMLVNKESFNYPQDTDSLSTVFPKFNRNVGLEYNLASANNQWTGKAFFLKSFAPNKNGNGISQAAHLEYKSRKWNWKIQEESVEDDYTAEVGFVPRNGYVNVTSYIGHLFFPKKSTILSHGPKLSASYFFNEKLERTDNINLLEYLLDFRDRSKLNFGVSDEYVELLSPFDPTRSGKESLDVGTQHHWNAYTFDFISKPQSMFTYSFGGRFGGYYSEGNRTSLISELGYRFQPFVSLSSNLSYNHINLPAPWNNTEFWLIGSEVDITFTNKLFFATLFQYNEQSKNFNLNSRFQWRYKPASDLFLVYSNNYLIEPFEGRNWALTLKFTYWFNK
ncbi:carbohydrate binding family 9 domain-containing protein [Arenibacter algicola]|uniref:Carbohydrate family 9 binding domain-like protein n=1 Tax=Arenibacter algicola TaxID=616991 RepID=A0A221UYX1_9FLAO|nr:carbohydrate binding family 9 domain-containing protein [Arenibacter algicola]ASO06091.1 carbohydrate family 9 binding domain-like protein [Arenibacter algicola]